MTLTDFETRAIIKALEGHYAEAIKEHPIVEYFYKMIEEYKNTKRDFYNVELSFKVAEENYNKNKEVYERQSKLCSYYENFIRNGLYIVEPGRCNKDLIQAIHTFIDE